MTDSELNRLIPPEIKNDEFYTAIQRIAREENIKTVLEIGSSSGEGSTEALVTGLRENPSKPTLFCMEVSKTRFAELEKRYVNDSFVKCYNVSSVSLEQFPDIEEVVNFYTENRTNLNHYPLKQVLDWLQHDTEYVRESGVNNNGIRKIKTENSIDFFDLVLIDGSEFTGNAELDEVYGAKYILLDDVNTYKNHGNLNRLSNSPAYTLVEHNPSVRNGYAIFRLKTAQPASYKTIKSSVDLIEGFMVPGQEEYLFNKVKSLPSDAVIVEIGSFKGRSTVAMATACIGTNRRVYCIDTWDGNNSDFHTRDFFVTWQQNVQQNALNQYVVPLQGHSHEVLIRWDELADGKAIDFIFIDGSHQYLDVLRDFELSFPLVKTGGWIAFHDVVHTWPGPEQVWHNIAKLHLVNHEYSSTLACGQKLSNVASFTATSGLPIHFFTIVLNGEPFIRYHIEVFKQLPFDWHWHIVEGVADLKHDTAWSLQQGGRITDEIHHNGHSTDDTTAYLDELMQYPENVTVYRKPNGVFWEGKREMVNAPLVNIHEECLLWQVDVDELWTVEQLCIGRQMFINNPDKTAAFYWCWYFVGEKLVISTRNCYAQNPQQEWLRTWRFKPGAVWVAHEPPRLAEPLPDGQWRDVASVNPFLHEETEQLNLIFQHFAYVTQEQLQFKEQYYGYKNAVPEWMKLQAQTKFPVLLHEYFSWVRDGTLVDSTTSCGVVPIAQKEHIGDVWHFLQSEDLQKQFVENKKVLPKIVIDGVFFQMYNTGIARVWDSLLREWADNGFAEHIVVLDRANTAPKIPGIKYRQVPAHSYANVLADREMLQQTCDEEGAELFVSTYYTTPLSTPSVFMVYDMIPEVMGWALNHPMWQEKHHAIQHASAHIAISENTARDLTKFFPHIPLESVEVALCGVRSSFSPASAEEVNSFKIKYGISKPYFVLVGIANGYKNSVLFFQAFARLYSKHGFEIVCTGSGPSSLEAEFRAYTSGSVVHLLQLSDEELRAAYSGAVALVYPSKYEGFGLPILEAFACECPVITCPNASIPEVAGEAVLYVNDSDVDGLTNALCDVQKPNIRNSLIAVGLEQARRFSWSEMAQTVSSALIAATLLPLKLRKINLIIFPDWSQPEDSLNLELVRVLQEIAVHPDSDHITLLIDTDDISEEDANLILSGAVMQVLMEEIDVTEGMEISLVSQLSQVQWSVLLPRVQARIVLEQENECRIAQVQAEQLPAYELDNFTSMPELLLNQHLDVLCIPPRFFQDMEELDNYYQRIQQSLDYLHRNVLKKPDVKLWQDAALYFTLNANSLRLYFTEANLKEIFVKRAEVMELGLKAQGHKLDHNFSERLIEPERIKLGIICDKLDPRPEIFATLPVFNHLSRDTFEIVVYILGSGKPRLERYVFGHADALVQLPDDLNAQVNNIRGDCLDIIFFATNVTSKTNSVTLLALHRLAPVQVVGMNTPVTTGMRNIDYYISGMMTEPEKDAQEQYAETLVTLDGPAQCFHFATEEQILETISVSREKLGIEQDAVVYISGANCQKIIPELEEVWARIIAAVPHSQLLLYPFNPNWSPSYANIPFEERLIATFAKHGLSEDRFKILGSVPNRADVKEYLKLGDIYLDSYPYSGMTSLIDPLAVGLPIVVREGSASRSRMGASLLRELQILDLITESEETYVQQAVALGTDPELFREKSDQVKQSMQRNPRFLNNPAYSAQIDSLFQKLHQRQLTNERLYR